MSDNYTTESRREWHRPVGTQLTDDNLKLGCFQRIATATELMAKRYNGLIEEAQREKQWRVEAQQRASSYLRSIASYKGQITKLRKRLAAITDKE